MKDQSFVIKVGDLLKQPGSQDEINFEKKFTEQLPNLNQEGLSGSVLLQSLDKNSILVSLINVKGILEDVCDVCQKKFRREFSGNEYKAKFILPEYDRDDENSNEEIFPIDPKDENINIEDMLVQNVILQDPIVRRCQDCEKNVPLSDDEDDIDYFEGRGNVVFK